MEEFVLSNLLNGRSEKIENEKEKLCYDILDNYSRILIIDMAGMGKSTIVKYFACLPEFLPQL